MSTHEDRLAIRELIDQAMILVDLRDYDGYGDLYTPDGRYESPFAQAQGPSEISAMSRRLTESGFTAGKRHFTGPVQIEVDGDHAQARSWFWVAETAGAPGVFATGTFTDQLEKRDGRWRFTHRKQDGDGQERLQEA
jgi:hypothetical protein